MLTKRIHFNFGKKKPQLAIWGWWQGNNLGDNWIKESLQHYFPQAIFINTDQKDFKAYAFILCGGGGLFIRDVIPPWDRPKQQPFGMLGLGAEFKHANQHVKELAAKAQFFYVRDQYSLDCMHLEQQNLSFDTTFSLPLSWKDQVDTAKCLFIWREVDELLTYGDFKHYIGERSLKHEWVTIIKNRYQHCVENDFYTTSCAIKSLTNDIDCIVSARYHGIIAAIQRGIPCIGIDVCPKIRALMHESGLGDYCLKLQEVTMLEDLLLRVDKEKDVIRTRQYEYRTRALASVKNHVQIAADIIEAHMRKR